VLTRLTGLARLAGNPWVRASLLAVVLACCGYAVYLEWPQVAPGLARLRWFAVVGSALAAMAGAGCMMLAWREILADLGSRLPVRAAVRANFVAQLAKYVPGAVWAFAAQVELGHDHDVPRRRGATSVLVALAVTVAVGLAVAAAALPLTTGAAAGHYLWFVVFIPVIAACLYPPVMARLINTALRLLRQEPLEQLPTLRGIARAIGWTVAGWLLLGLQVWLVLANLTSHVSKSLLLLLAVGAFALACSAALLLVVFPGGIGAREVIMITTLAATVPHGTATLAAIVVRLTTTASDLAWGGTALSIGRSARAKAAQARSMSPDSMRPDSMRPDSMRPDSARADALPAAVTTSRPERGRHRKPSGQRVRGETPAPLDPGQVSDPVAPA
jgi:uncharacterized membrane protein YbhN (UPF0104 family)